MVVVVCSIVACAGDTDPTGRAQGEITIATFNVQVFGESKRAKAGVMDVLADVADEFDVIATNCKNQLSCAGFRRVTAS